MSTAPRFISFFSGALGLDIGLEEAGFKCLSVNEMDRATCETIRANRPDLRLYDSDLRDLTVDGLMQDLSIESGEIEAVVGGPPCQAFSTAGKRRSLDDERGNLVLHFLDLAIGLQPKWIVVENVRGLLSAPLQHRPHNERGKGHPPLLPEELPGGALARVLTILEDAGYCPTFNLYDAANFSVPQRRERLIIIASKDGTEVPHIRPSCPQESWQTFRQSTESIGEEHEICQLRSVQRRLLKHLGPGQNWRNLPPRLQKEALGKAYMSSGGRVGFMRRIAWNEPSPTLVTSPAMPATLLAHPEEMRPLSVQEYKRLQGFPDDWVVCGSTTSKYRQLGNAVPVGLARALGNHLLRYQRDKRHPNSVDTPTSRYLNTSDKAWRRQYADMIAEARQVLTSV